MHPNDDLAPPFKVRRDPLDPALGDVYARDPVYRDATIEERRRRALELKASPHWLSDEQLLDLLDRHQKNHGAVIERTDFLLLFREVVKQTAQRLANSVAEYLDAKDAFDTATRPESGWARPKTLRMDDPIVQRLNTATDGLRAIATAYAIGTWTPEDQATAAAEGWGLFGHPDDPSIEADDEAKVFHTDDDALRFVRQLAKAGRLHAQRAIALHDGNANNRSRP